jgi:hypothetical protein
VALGPGGCGEYSGEYRGRRSTPGARGAAYSGAYAGRRSTPARAPGSGGASRDRLLRRRSRPGRCGEYRTLIHAGTGSWMWRRVAMPRDRVSGGTRRPTGAPRRWRGGLRLLGSTIQVNRSEKGLKLCPLLATTTGSFSEPPQGFSTILSPPGREGTKIAGIAGTQEPAAGSPNTAHGARFRGALRRRVFRPRHSTALEGTRRSSALVTGRQRRVRPARPQPSSLAVESSQSTAGRNPPRRRRHRH